MCVCVCVAVAARPAGLRRGPPAAPAGPAAAPEGRPAGGIHGSQFGGRGQRAQPHRGLSGNQQRTTSQGGTRADTRAQTITY